MTGRPYGGRVAEAPMPTADQEEGVPGSAGSPDSAVPPDAGRP